MPAGKIVSISPKRARNFLIPSRHFLFYGIIKLGGLGRGIEIPRKRKKKFTPRPAILIYLKFML